MKRQFQMPIRAFLVCIIAFHFGLAQTIPHEYIVNPKSKINKLKLYKEFELAGEINEIDQQLCLLRFRSDFSPDQEVKFLQSLTEIQSFRPNRSLTNRTCRSNDPDLIKQWHIAKQQFDELWCYSTSGLSPNKDSIVVGVLDDGFAYDQADLLANIFRNYNEVPDNNLDDDSNGYIDDHFGYNARIGKTDNHFSERHGTAVSSMIAAVGNNGVQISGVSPGIKLLLCSATNEFAMIDCYNYFYAMRSSYNLSNGKKGAFVVACNTSAGFDDAFPQDFPKICDAYNKCGSVGILNSAAVRNDGVDIEKDGDIPGLCPSNYLITVTNTDINDRKVERAAFNKTHVDIGAGGEDVYLLDNLKKVSVEGGTSFSAPQAAALAASLYQFCPKLSELAKSKPDSAALLVKSFILECGDPNSSLNLITRTGKRLNALKAYNCLQVWCGGLVENSTLRIQPSILSEEEEVEIYYQANSYGEKTISVFDASGRLIYNKKIDFQESNPKLDKLYTKHWPSGVYYLTLRSNKERLSTSFVKI
ncbi:MAG TPA: S8 family serine peptidase [Saprospiraceae bacterium]|nr:S8 family serine peptidase [Saprospiraceae bacterium]